MHHGFGHDLAECPVDVDDHEELLDELELLELDDDGLLLPNKLFINGNMGWAVLVVSAVATVTSKIIFLFIINPPIIFLIIQLRVLI